jgi:hypothetical protein
MRRSPVVLLAVLLVAGAGLAPSATAEEPQPLVLFEDQRTTGSIVIVDLAQLPDGGFVVLHEPGSGGELGPVVGASTLLGAGLHQPIPVPLFDNVTAETNLVAALYQDTNDNGALDVADGHDHHGHDHDSEDATYKDGDLPVGDQARVQPYGTEETSSTEVNPLLVGAATAIASLALWAVRYR